MCEVNYVSLAQKARGKQAQVGQQAQRLVQQLVMLCQMVMSGPPVDLLRGIAVYAGLEVIEVPGATGTIDTNYSGKVKGALEALSRHDFAYLHVEAPDEASHEGDLEGKIRAIELLDQMVVGPVIEGLEKSGEDWRILLLPDHATPISIRTHSRDPVPFVIMGRGIEPDGLDRFDEQSAEQGGYGRVDATALVRMLAA